MTSALSSAGRFLKRNGRMLASLSLLAGIGAAAAHAFAAAPGAAPVAAGAAPVEVAKAGFQYFSFLTDPHFSSGERVALFGSLIVALLGCGCGTVI